MVLQYCLVGMIRPEEVKPKYDGDVRDRTRGLPYAKQTLYHWATSPYTLFYSNQLVFLKGVRGGTSGLKSQAEYETFLHKCECLDDWRQYPKWFLQYWLVGMIHPEEVKPRGMRHTSTGLYFYGVSKKTLQKPRVTFGNMLFQASYSLNYYLQLLC